MARKRMIDPSIWTDEGMAELTPRQQLLYIGLISNADDDGRMKCSPSALRLALPTIYAAIDLIEIANDLQAVCATMRQIVVYAVDGRSYLVFRNYRKWQRIDKPSASILPPPPECADDSRRIPGTFVESSPNDPGAVPPNRREVKLTEEKREEGVTRADAPPPAIPEVAKNEPISIKRGKPKTVLPADFTVTDEMRLWAKRSAPDVNLVLHTERFENYWRGEGLGKSDWVATWRNWMLGEQDKINQGGSRFVSQAEINKARPGKFVGA